MIIDNLSITRTHKKNMIIVIFYQLQELIIVKLGSLNGQKSHWESQISLRIWISMKIVKLLALALTNLVLDLANLVTNSAKPSLDWPGH